MKFLIAEDSFHQREALQALLEDWGYQVESVSDGTAAWNALQMDHAPARIMLESDRTGRTGPELCPPAGMEPTLRPRSVILLTVRAEAAELRQGLETRADEDIAAPCPDNESGERQSAGGNAVPPHLELAERPSEPQAALDRVEKLTGIFPICARCKETRGDRENWKPVEEYLSTRSEMRFRHSICPACYSVCVEPVSEGELGKR
jgi:CheY-like chemotaxis protein